MNPDEISFLRGLIAGEGCFQIGLGKNNAHKHNVQVQPNFQMGMVEDSNILPLLQEKTGLGSVYDDKRKNENRRDAESWQIRAKQDVKELIQMIEKQEDSLFWKTDKGEAFKEWKRGIQVKENGGTSDAESVKELIRISKDLNNTERGRSEEDWIKIVEDAQS